MSIHRLIWFVPLVALLLACGASEETASPESTLPDFSDLSFTLMENSAAASVLGSLLSEPYSGALQIQITAGNDAGFFSVENQHLVLTAQAAIDYETQDRYQLTVRISDSSGNSQLISVLLQVQDIEVEAEATLAIPLANNRFSSAHFRGSAVCGDCHNGIRDRLDNDVSIETEWSTSVMAHSAKDPFWRAKVSTEMQRNPHLSEEIAETCTRCHAPMANVEWQASQTAAPQVFNQGFLDADSASYALAQDGVSCTLCHQIADADNLGELESFSGHYEIHRLNQSGSRMAFAQYANPLINPMLNDTGFEPAQSAHLSGSEVCGTCHNLKTPFVDAEGQLASTTPESEFPEQMIYSEWEHSDFEDQASTPQSCQQCHMRQAQGVIISNRPNGQQSPPEREQFSRHGFLGANATLLELLHNQADALGVRVDLQNSIEATRAFLQSAASLSLKEVQTSASELQFSLTISNHSGHKLPSGYPSRRVFVEVLIEDQSGNKRFHSGQFDAEGRIQGVDDESNATSYEEHQNSIRSADTVPVYEAVMHNTDNQLTFTLLRAAGYLKDNRLLPSGFDKTTVPDDVKVVGAALQDPDFVAAADTLHYRLPLTIETGDRLRVRLHYQSFSYAFLRDLLSQPELAEVARLAQLLADGQPRLTQLVDELVYEF